MNFGDLFEESIPRKKMNDEEFITFLGMQDVSENAAVISQHRLRITEVKPGFTYFERNDVLVAKITPCFENGKGALLDKLETKVGYGSTEFHVLRAKKGNDARYIFHVTCTKTFRQRLEREMVGSAGHRRVPLAEIQKYELPVKHDPIEQAAIANALSDADALIQSLQKLIAKKRQIKQGAMQTLLNPFENGVLKTGWMVKPLGAVAEVIMGQSPSGNTYNKSGEGIALINGPTEFTDVSPIKVQWTNQPTKLCKKNDLLICVRGSSTGRMNISNDEYCIGRGVAAIRANLSSNTIYLTNQIKLGIEKLLGLSAGSTFPNVDGKSIRSIEIPLPPTIEEQTRIATILTDMDADIAALETKLTKYQKIKQGMMQNLLTGRIRLA